MRSVEIKSVDKEQLRRSVDAYAARVFACHPEVEEIVVFGSFAKGNYAPGSDIDIFILISHSDESVRDRIPDFMPDGPFPVGVDVFPYTRREVSNLAPSPLLDEVAESRWRYTRKQSGETPST